MNDDHVRYVAKPDIFDRFKIYKLRAKKITARQVILVSSNAGSGYLVRICLDEWNDTPRDQSAAVQEMLSRSSSEVDALEKKVEQLRNRHEQLEASVAKWREENDHAN